MSIGDSYYLKLIDTSHFLVQVCDQLARHLHLWACLLVSPARQQPGIAYTTFDTHLVYCILCLFLSFPISTSEHRRTPPSSLLFAIPVVVKPDHTTSALLNGDQPFHLRQRYRRVFTDGSERHDGNRG